MSSRPDLKLDWCSFEAAKFAVERWHYSRCMPSGKLVKIGVWENKEFIGVVIFGRGANHNIGKSFGCNQTEICELVRIALRTHSTPVSRIMAIAFLMLKKLSDLRLCISYADPSRGHVGSVYQASNWIYTGTSSPQSEVVVNGVRMHKRTASAKFGSIKNLDRAPISWKHKYLMPLDDEMRARIAPLARPYPKRAGSADSGTTDFQSGRGGATPTPALSQNHGADDAAV